MMTSIPAESLTPAIRGSLEVVGSYAGSAVESIRRITPGTYSSPRIGAGEVLGADIQQALFGANAIGVGEDFAAIARQFERGDVADYHTLMQPLGDYFEGVGERARAILDATA